MSNWNMNKLSDVAKIQQSTKQNDSNIIWLLNLDMIEQQTGNIIDYSYVTQSEIGNSTIKFDEQNVLYSKLRPNLNKVVCPEKSGYATSELVPLLPDLNIITREYLTLYLRSSFFVDWAVSKTAGAKMPRLSPKELMNKAIPIPPLDVQKRMTATLDKLQSIITHRKQQLLKLDELVKARFVEMFGDPVDNPLGWDKKQLQEIVSDDCMISYGIVQTGDDQVEGVPVFRPVDIVNRMPVLSELKKTTKEISDRYKRTILRGHELLLTVRANIADTCIVGEEFAGCNVGRGIVPLRTKETIVILEFLKYQLDNRHLNDRIKSKAKGITLVQLNMEDLRLVELIVPPIELQKSYVSFAKQTDKSKVVKET